MAKIHPHSLLSSSSSSSSSSSLSTLLREEFTIWMKSLILNGNGCTIYDNSTGQIAYRVDNYDTKSSGKVYLMDPSGQTLYKILQKKLRVFGRWEGFKCIDSNVEDNTAWFRVQKEAGGILWPKQRSFEARVTFESSSYKIYGSNEKSAYKIVDMAKGLVAEVKRKQTDSGIVLGDDVMILTVEPNVDRLLIMGLVVVCGLINQHI